MADTYEMERMFAADNEHFDCERWRVAWQGMPQKKDIRTAARIRHGIS